MARGQGPGFINEAILKRFSPDLLLELFRKEAGEALGRRAPDGQPWVPSTVEPGDLDYERLVRFLSAERAAPIELLDALYRIDEVAQDDLLDQLFEVAGFEHRALHTLRRSLSNHDCALKVWLKNPAAVERVAGEQLLRRAHRFVVYAGAGPAQDNTLPPCDEESSCQLQARLSEEFERRNQSDFARVVRYERDKRTWLLIRRAERVQRKEVVESSKPVTRPMRFVRHDILIIDGSFLHLNVSGGTEQLQQLYASQLGLLLAQDATHFVPWPIYTLEPLLKADTERLAPTCESPSNRAVLRQVVLFRPGSDSETHTIKAKDALRALREHLDDTRHKDLRVKEATFSLPLTRSAPRGGRRSLSLTIRPPYSLICDQERDYEVVRDWLVRSEFVAKDVKLTYDRTA